MLSHLCAMHQPRPAAHQPGAVPCQQVTGMAFGGLSEEEVAAITQESGIDCPLAPACHPRAKASGAGTELSCQPGPAVTGAAAGGDAAAAAASGAAPADGSWGAVRHGRGKAAGPAKQTDAGPARKPHSSWAAFVAAGSSYVQMPAYAAAGGHYARELHCHAVGIALVGYHCHRPHAAAC